MAIIRPRFVAIDSSALGELVREMNSARGAHHHAALEIKKRIHEGTVLPILSLTLVSELVQHGDPQIVADRLGALAEIPNLAYVRSLKYPTHVGSIVDLGAAEVDAAYIRRLREPAAIAERAKSTVLALGKGRDLVSTYRAMLPELKQRLAPRLKESQIIASLAHVDVMGNRRQSLRAALRDAVGFRKDVEVAASDLAEKLASTMESEGDKKLEDRREIAHAFIAMQMDEFKELSKSTLSVLDAMCKTADVDIRAVNLDMTLGEFFWMAVYQKHLDIFVETLGLPTRLTEYDVPSGLLPHWIVRREILHARRGAMRASGSDLGDDQLAALACYADLTVVDKRTYGHLEQGLKRSAYLRQCLRPIARVRDTSDLAEQLSKLAA
jgi:hypothetical protein